MEMGLSVSEMARRLGRHRSTIERELARNRCVDGYRPDSAERRAWARKLRGSKIARSTRLRAHVEDRLAMGWSPEQIAGRMELDGAEHAIGAESIYRHACAGAAQSEARSTTAQRSPRAVDPNPPSTDKGPSSQPVLTLGGRSDALPPPTRHPAYAAGRRSRAAMSASLL
jgi:IS30 family transposase